jgi:arsenical resistance protein ArsH
MPLPVPDLDDLPNIAADAFALPDPAALHATGASHPPRILLLYGSLRQRSYSRFLTLEAERLLRHFGAETRVFHANGLPLPDDVSADHAKVQELRALSTWSEGQVWCSPERHGAMTGSPSSLAKGASWGDGRMSSTASEGRHRRVPKGVTTIGRFIKIGC